MAQVMVAAGAGGLVCWLSAALLARRRDQPVAEDVHAEPRDPSREEDLVRPAVSASGQRIWVEPDQLIWHEIVSWPEANGDARRGELRRWA